MDVPLTPPTRPGPSAKSKGVEADAARYRSLVTTSPQGLVFHDSTGRVVSWNAAAARILGMHLDHVPGLPPPMTVPAGEPPPVWEMIRDDGTDFPPEELPAIVALRTGAPVEEVLMGVRSPGSPEHRWVLVSALPQMHDEGGRPSEVICCLVDVTDLRRAREGWSQTEARFRTVFAEARTGMIIADSNGRITDVNAAASEMLGYKEGELFGVEVTRLSHPEDWSKEESLFQELSQGRRTSYEMEKRYIRRNGDIRWARLKASSMRGSAPDSRFVLTILEDVTERVETDRSVRYQAQLLDSVGEALIATDARGRIRYWNRLAERVFGWTKEEVMGRPVAEITTPPDDRAAAERILEMLMRGETWSGEFELQRKDGSRFPAFVVDSPILDADGELVGIIGITTDLTGREDHGARIAHSQKMEAIGELAGGIAHDFNNLMMTVGGYAQMLLEEVEPEDSRYSDLLEIVRAAERATGLSRKLLAIGKRKPLVPDAVDLEEVLNDMYNLLARTIGENIDLRIDSVPGCIVEIDQSQLETAILNLALNSRDAMPEGGELSLHCSIREGVAAEVAASTQGYVVLEVTDSGTGMSAEVQRRVFEPFFTTKEEGKGSGLGLPTVYEIIRKGGGWIELESRAGEGTTFRIHLPRIVSPTATEAVSQDDATARGTETVLLVEDDESVRAMVERVLTDAGYTVLTASNGRMAIEIAAAHEGKLDLLLTDIVMPELGGIPLAERMAAERTGMKPLFLTGYPADVALGGSALSSIPILAKPVRPKELLRSVRETLDG